MVTKFILNVQLLVTACFDTAQGKAQKLQNRLASLKPTIGNKSSLKLFLAFETRGVQSQKNLILYLNSASGFLLRILLESRTTSRHSNKPLPHPLWSLSLLLVQHLVQV